MKKLLILGAGKMGSGMAHLALKKGWQVNVWDRTPEILSAIQESGESPHLPGIKIEGVSVCSDIKEGVEGISLLVLSVPSFAVREMCKRLLVFKNFLLPILTISKGFEKGTAKLPFEIVQEVLGKKNIMHISGIGYPPELIKPRPVTEIIASRNPELLDEFSGLFETDFIKFQKSADLIGAQIGGALKNVLVIAIGMVTASESNAEQKQELIAKFIPIGVEEMKKLGKAMGAEQETFEGSAGAGDLKFSADPASRNFRTGESIWRTGIDQVMKELRANRKTVEGLISAEGAYKLSKKHNLDLSIIQSVYEVIYQRRDSRMTANELLGLL